jgi:uncharacterized membrane protein (TIGR02234 family)
MTTTTSPKTSGRRSSFGLVLLLGLATAALMAVSTSQTWLHATGNAAAASQKVEISGSDSAPLGLALSLVALASWGVILVSRTRARRAAAVIGVLATLGVLAVLVALWPDAESVARRVLTQQGASGVAGVSHGAWYWVTGVAALAQVAVLVTAIRAAPSWPSMSSRYDAPGERLDPAPSDVAAPGGRAGEQPADLELWKALDEGRDPTTRRSP